VGELLRKAAACGSRHDGRHQVGAHGSGPRQCAARRGRAGAEGAAARLGARESGAGGSIGAGAAQVERWRGRREQWAQQRQERAGWQQSQEHAGERRHGPGGGCSERLQASGGRQASSGLQAKGVARLAAQAARHGGERWDSGGDSRRADGA
jgi:hypothetical protein